MVHVHVNNVLCGSSDIFICLCTFTLFTTAIQKNCKCNYYKILQLQKTKKYYFSSEYLPTLYMSVLIIIGVPKPLQWVWWLVWSVLRQP